MEHWTQPDPADDIDIEEAAIDCDGNLMLIDSVGAHFIRREQIPSFQAWLKEVTDGPVNDD